MLRSGALTGAKFSTSKLLRREMPILAAGILLAGGCASGPGQPRTAGNAPTQVDNSSDPVDAIIRMHVPGLVVSRTSDGGVALQLSDPPSSIDRDNAPLYLLDESPFEAGPMGELNGINPADIASVKVLRRASAAIYGLRGANGVIAITTKRASAKK
jgi:TonB-dependent SusC/RagA subfamily outer membrane receptor